MTTTTHSPSRTIHLPTETPSHAAPATTRSTRKGLRLTDLRVGDTARVLRVVIESGCRKRFAELGIAEGMKVTVASTGDTLMLIIGGSRMAVAARCAEAIYVTRVAG